MAVWAPLSNSPSRFSFLKSQKVTECFFVVPLANANRLFVFNSQGLFWVNTGCEAHHCLPAIWFTDPNSNFLASFCRSLLLLCLTSWLFYSESSTWSHLLWRCEGIMEGIIFITSVYYIKMIFIVRLLFLSQFGQHLYWLWKIITLLFIGLIVPFNSINTYPI